MVTALAAVVQMVRGVPLDWWVLGALLIGSFGLFIYADRRGRRERFALLRELEASSSSQPPLVLPVREQSWQWTLPTADVVLQEIETLKQMPEKVEVRILAEDGGHPLADLLVRMFRLAGWSVQENPADVSSVFPVQRRESKRGICLRYRYSSFPALAAVQLEFAMFFRELLGSVTREEISEPASENFLQIEIGSRPS